MTRARAIIGAYLGVLFFAAFVFLGAWKLAYWRGLLYVVLALTGVTLNQVLEDRLLLHALPGNRDYAAKTRWRLVPGVF